MRKISIIILIVFIGGGFLVPSATHANGLEDVGSFSLWTLNGVLASINVGLEAIKGLLVSGLTWTGSALQSVLELTPSTGGYPVYTVWKILRDMCNMGFIVLIIAVSFATIFNFGWKTAFYWKSALPNIIIAALLLNLSLPIGQTIISAGNKASDSILKLMGGKDFGKDIIDAVEVSKIISGKPMILAAPPSSSVQLSELGPAEQLIVKGWVSATGTGTITVAGNYAANALRNCIEQKRGTPQECYSNEATKIYNNVVQQIESAAKIKSPKERNEYLAQAHQALKNISPIYAAMSVGANNLVTAYNIASGAFVNADSSTTTAKITAIMSTLMQIFMLFVLWLSMLTIIVFMVMRIPALWFLLAVSATAFFTFGIPGNKWFKDWFGYMAGWTIFGPAYLAIIYFGLFVLQQQNSLTATLTNQDLPFFSSTISVVMFFVVACVMFMGGAAWAYSFSFSFVPKGGGFLSAESMATGISSILGTDKKGGFGITQTSRTLGIQPALEGAVAGIEKRYERVIKQPFDERQKRIREGASTALEGGKAREDYLKKQLEEKKKAITDRLSKEREDVRLRLENLRAKEQEAKMGTNPRAEAKATAARQKVEAEYKALEKEQEGRLAKMFDTGTQDEKIAAGEMLMDKGVLSVDQMRKLQLMFAGISPVAGQAFIQKRDKKLIEEASKRKYKTGQEFQQYMDLIGDDKKAKEFFDAGLRGNNKVWAIVAGTQRKLITDASGKSMSLDAAMEKHADSFSATDVVRAEQHYFDEGKTVPEKVNRRIKRALYSPKERDEVLLEAKEQPQRVRLIKTFRQFRNDARALQKDIFDKQIEVNKARTKYKNSNTPSNFKDLQEREKELDDLTDKARTQGVPYGGRNRGNQNNPPPATPPPAPAAAPAPTP